MIEVEISCIYPTNHLQHLYNFWTAPVKFSCLSLFYRYSLPIWYVIRISPVISHDVEGSFSEFHFCLLNVFVFRWPRMLRKSVFLLFSLYIRHTWPLFGNPINSFESLNMLQNKIYCNNQQDWRENRNTLEIPKPFRRIYVRFDQISCHFL